MVETFRGNGGYMEAVVQDCGFGNGSPFRLLRFRIPDDRDEMLAVLDLIAKDSSLNERSSLIRNYLILAEECMTY